MIRKKRPDGNFTMISNGIFRDTRLNLTDRGLLTTLISLPPNWDFSVEGMATILPDGKGRIRSSLKRLAGLGYVSIVQDRSIGGRFKKNLLIINSDVCPPFSENPPTDNPQMEKPSTGNGTQYKNYDTRTNNTRRKDIDISSLDDQDNTARRKEKRKNAFMNFQQRDYPPEFYQDLEAKLSGFLGEKE